MTQDEKNETVFDELYEKFVTDIFTERREESNVQLSGGTIGIVYTEI